MVKHIAEVLELPIPQSLGRDCSETISNYERQQRILSQRLWMDHAELPRRIRRHLEAENKLRMDITPMVEIPRALNQGTIVVVCGAPGTGKSVAACYTMMVHLRGRYLRADRYADIIKRKSSFNEAGRIAISKVRRIRDTPLLTIDDCGEEYDRDVSKIASLIEERYDGERSTILTTNLTPKQFSDRYGPRIRSRLGEVGEAVICMEVVRPSRRGT